MRISEIFSGVQGEGMRTGKLSTFIRVAGCTLCCKLCDTTYSYTEKAKNLTVDEIMKQVPSNVKDIVVTGGEPIRTDIKDEMQELLQRLWKLGKVITVETNATYYFEDLIPYVSLWSLSPKLSCMGEKNRCNIEVIEDYVRRLNKYKMQLKFVLTPEMKDELLDVLKKVPLIEVDQIPVILQPMDLGLKESDCYAEKIRECYVRLLDVSKEMQEYNLYLLLQAHKTIFGNKRGV